MKAIDTYQNKNVLVLGMARSGYAAAKLLTRLGARVTVNDRAKLDGDDRVQEFKRMGIRVIDGGHPLELVDEHVDIIIKNPVIPYHNPLIVKAEQLNIPIITEVELAGQVSEADFVGITGSNGKTTTTTLAGLMLQESALMPITAGNIGTPLCDVVLEASSRHVIVAELSSFQLMGIRSFRPKVACILNLFNAHLDFHGSLEAYGKAKAMITKNQGPEDVLVYNADDPRVVQLIQGSQAKKISFSMKAQGLGAFLKGDTLYYLDEAVLRRDELAMPNVDHNVANALAAIAIAKSFGVKSDAIRGVLQTFTGVPHRLQYVTTIAGRAFYNDSKATNILATTKALSAFHQPVILLAGGLDRGNDFSELVPALKGVKAVIAFGETKDKLAETARAAGVKTVRTVDNVQEAVPVAYGISNDGDVILLSPACASWDQFRTFEERGDMFIKTVHTL
ncbi:UDP-N-acetylmuramoyl-L-alanine--D-glutamate ligase [Camelliibacillus cellulosilyticus]|uniref:UDP-N-acetylmuramoylalanine--D-glutamate ligase n=1 Tax=Camelliibacillus cellulosilyticus TaxID=2174486 RepID=A0ABV9GJ34_9BACL